MTDHTPDEPTGRTDGHQHQWVSSAGILVCNDILCPDPIGMRADYANALEQQVRTLTEDCDALAVQAQEAQAALEVFIELVREREWTWVDVNGRHMCPFCRQTETEGHTAGCPVGDAMRNLPAAIAESVAQRAREVAFIAAALELDNEISGYGPYMDGTFGAYKVISHPDARERVRRFRELAYDIRLALGSGSGGTEEETA